MSDEPIRFTEEQRQLFRRVAAAVRSWPEAFHEAGRWIDEKAVAEAFERVRRGWLSEARHRRQQSRKHGPEVGRFWMVPPPIGRSDMGRERRRERREMRTPSNWRIIDHATHALLSDPPDYDVLRPDLAERQARRVLLAVWIMTDPRELATEPRITKLQAWEWGASDYEAVPTPLDHGNPHDPAGMAVKINRRYARTQVLDRHLNAWEQMSGDALRYLNEAGLLHPLREDAPASPVPAAEANDDPDDRRSPGSKPGKEPTADALAAYRLHIATGLKQTKLAEELTRRIGRPVNQGQVSRWLRQVRAWLRAGNVLPELPGLKRAPASVDPSHLDMGERTDGRTRRQRQKRV